MDKKAPGRVSNLLVHAGALHGSLGSSVNVSTWSTTSVNQKATRDKLR